MSSGNQPKPVEMPAGLTNAYFFQVFNTASFSLATGAPMLLFLKYLGASATVLGVAASLSPFLNILQIPAARFVEQIGYRAFVVKGWSLRSYLILGLAGVAFLPSAIDSTTRIVLMLALLFIYNTLRGISVCGFLPWMSQLVPEPLRGSYLSKDQMSSATANVVAMLSVAWFLRDVQGNWAFGLIFLSSFGAAMVSLGYLRQIPDVPVPEASRTRQPVPWRALFGFLPFRKLMIYNFVVQSAYAAGGVFWIPFLRDDFHATDSKIMVVGALSVTVTGCSLWLFGRVVDRVGSRPVLALSSVIHALHFSCWGAVAAGVLPFSWPVIAVQSVLSGLPGALFNLANTRLIMGTVPAMGRSHFFALISVTNNLTIGLMPILWGVMLDSLRGCHAQWGGWTWTQFSFLYAVLALTMVAAQFFLHRLDEPRAMTTEAFFHELFVGTPARALSRLLPRRLFWGD